ncbi:MAG: class I SAM-dependent methyltransferase [Gammaproteobacteria bacterium]|nr:class I SAM-dependent methyltransferase [Gammaproteobacteria bacterium]
MSEFIGKTNSLITFRNSQGIESRGTLLKLTRTTIVIEIYNPYSIVQLSEVLQNLTVRRGDRAVYNGRAVISNLVNTGLMLIASATLVDPWTDLSCLLRDNNAIGPELENFVDNWNKTHRIRPGYQLAVGELRSFMSELNRWLGQLDLVIEDQQPVDRASVAEGFFNKLFAVIGKKLVELFIKFEQEAGLVPQVESDVHKSFVQWDLHPLMMRAPFVHRAYSKPLGYAGDYEMVNMMFRDPRDGPTLYAQLINYLYLQVGPVKAHRNRIDILVEHLSRLVSSHSEKFTVANILNIGCGPAIEIQRLIKYVPLQNSCAFRLLDFNQETLSYVKNTLDDLMQQHANFIEIDYIHESVHSLLKQSTKKQSTISEEYDFVYCAGLFDYLSDKVCNRLINLYYQWVKPGGTLLVTNVHPCNPDRWAMEYIAEWFLIYRNEEQMKKLVPGLGEQHVYADETGINLFLEIRKPGE